MTSTSKINVFLVDDYPELLKGLQMLFGEVPDIQVVGTADSGLNLLHQLSQVPGYKKKTAVDLILMDIKMDDLDGWETTRKVKQFYPHIKVILFSFSDQMQEVNKSIACGADGFLSKINGRDKIIQAIREINQSTEFLVYTHLKQESSPSQTYLQNSKIFTSREQQIICLICREFDLSAIASYLGLSTFSISTQIKIIKSKLGVQSLTGIVREAINRSLCESIPLSEEL